jgi:tRNA(fMet)-specific endonuclease VapC
MLLIDTDAVSHLVRGSNRGQLIDKLSAVPAEDRCISVITLAELLYGLERKKPAPKLCRRLDAFLNRVAVLPFDEEAAKVYARIRSRVERAGKPLPHADLQIASIAMSRDLRLLTGNIRHFDRIEGLQIENF